MKNAFLRLMNFQNLTIILLMVILTACLDKTETPASTPTGYVNLYNAAADGTSLDIYLNDSKVNTTPFDYSKYSGYLNFPTGNNTVTFNQYNTTTKLVEITFKVTESKAYSLFTINEEDAQLATLFLLDSSAEANAGKSRLRFIHLSPSFAPDPTVVLDLKETGSTESPFFSNTSYKSASPFIEVASKTYSFDLINKADGTILTTLTDVNLESAKYYTIIARGFVKLPEGENNKITLQLLKN